MRKLLQRIFIGKPSLDKVLGNFRVTMTELERLAEDRREEQKAAKEARRVRAEQYNKDLDRMTAQYYEDQAVNRGKENAAQDDAERAEQVHQKIANLIGEDQ